MTPRSRVGNPPLRWEYQLRRALAYRERRTPSVHGVGKSRLAATDGLTHRPWPAVLAGQASPPGRPRELGQRLRRRIVSLLPSALALPSQNRSATLAEATQPRRVSRISFLLAARVFGRMRNLDRRPAASLRPILRSGIRALLEAEECAVSRRARRLTTISPAAVTEQSSSHLARRTIGLPSACFLAANRSKPGGARSIGTDGGSRITGGENGSAGGIGATKVSTMKVRVAGLGSMLSASSVARTSKVCDGFVGERRGGRVAASPTSRTRRTSSRSDIRRSRRRPES